MINFAKGVRNYFVLALVVLTFCLLSMLSIPVCTVGTKDLMQDYNAFDSALMQMYNKYDDGLDSQIVSLASTEETTTKPINRLIVTTENEIDDCGAVAKAEFEEYHIFQYSDDKSAQAAYETFDSMEGVEVGYDAVVSVNYEVAENEEIVADTTYTFNSWGANYVGYETYINSMLSAAAEEDLEDVVVAVLDSGINTSHVLFEGRILHDYARSWISETTSTKYLYEDMNGHGTHVSGTIAESTLSNVKILPLKVLNASGKGYVSSIVSAINYACTLAKNSLPGLKVLNMSIGVDDSSSAQGETVGAKSVSLTTAVQNAYNNGILSVVSAGNENRNTAYAVPANVDCAITVSALQESYEIGTGRRLVFHGAYIDERGYEHWGYSNYGSHVDFCAPGTSIRSAYIGGSQAVESLNGTSMAAPHVTAAVALVYSNPDFKDYDFEELMTLLKQNADKSQLHTSGRFSVSSGERDDYYGYGLISVKNIGVLSSGYISFSNQNEFPNAEFQLQLSYDGDYNKNAGEYVTIYYTDNENTISLDLNSADKKLYSSPIKISETTKITAVAYIYDAENTLLKKSHSSSFVYYFDNFDLKSNYVLESSGNDLVVTKYNGKLETLAIQENFDGSKIVAIDEGAFNDSKVKSLTLPDVDNFKLNSRAFYSNGVIESVYAIGDTMQIGSEAFRYCSALSYVDVENVSNVGDFAFANTTKIEELYLQNVTAVGQHAISGSNVKYLMVGKNVSSFGTQSNLVLEKIYGYDCCATIKDFASENEIEFCDLTLRITDDLNSRKIVKQSDSVVLEFEFIGYEPTYVLNGMDFLYSTIIELDDFKHQLKIDIADLLVDEYDISITLIDFYNDEISSSSTKLIVVSDTAETYDINFEQGDYEILIDGEVIQAETELFKGFDYQIDIVAKAGYEIETVSLNDNEVSTSVSISNLAETLNFDVSTKEKEILNVDFYVEAGGKVLIDGVEVESSVVDRNHTLDFIVQSETGYKIEKVLVNGQELSSQSNTYSVENVVQDLTIVVEFSIIKYKVSVTAGKGGTVFRKGVQLDSADIAYGSDLEFDIVCTEGYEVDFVTVNGKQVELDGNSFVIEKIDQDCDIIVSFKVAKSSLFDGEHSVVLKYFVIFACMFVIFIIAKIVLSIVRKKKKSV